LEGTVNGGWSSYATGDTPWRCLFGSLLVLAAFAAAANGANDSLAARHESALATPEGAAYQEVVGRTVAEDYSSIQKKCVPRFGITSNATFLFEISPDGVVGASDVSPRSPGGNCALTQIRQIRFPGAPPNFVGKFKIGPPTLDFYPPESRKLKEEGITRVRVCVDERGKLIGEPLVVVSSGYPRLDEASIKLAKAGSGRYKPATRDGKPVADCTEININWKLT
jgi:TonB family protein